MIGNMLFSNLNATLLYQDNECVVFGLDDGSVLVISLQPSYITPDISVLVIERKQAKADWMRSGPSSEEKLSLHKELVQLNRISFGTVNSTVWAGFSNLSKTWYVHFEEKNMKPDSDCSFGMEV